MLSYHGLATRNAAGIRMIEAHLVVHRTATVGASHAVADHIRDDLLAQFPGARVMIHVDPCGPTGETCGSRSDSIP